MMELLPPLAIVACVLFIIAVSRWKIGPPIDRKLEGMGKAFEEAKLGHSLEQRKL